jgi:hypothetical protein
MAKKRGFSSAACCARPSSSGDGEALRHLPPELGRVRAVPLDDGDFEYEAVELADAEEVRAELLVMVLVSHGAAPTGHH